MLSPATVESNLKDLATRLSACCKTANILVSEIRDWHRALVDSCHPDPRVYLPGDIVFARRATRSDASKGCVGKLEYKFTGPWRIIESLKGASYAIKHCLTPTQKEKKHASDLTLYPSELIPLSPSMALILNMVNSTNPSAHTHLRRLVQKDFHCLPHSKLPRNTSTLAITRISIGLLWWS
jgi:hypothetical protein